MVHRIQNRNPGYSDFSNLNTPESFTLQTSANTPISDGATALKLEEEINLNDQTGSSEMQNTEVVNENYLSNKNELENQALLNNINETQQENLHEEPSNGLENFDLKEEESLELFDNTNENQNSLEQKEEQEQEEEDELEIPAFLRRQKN